MEDFKPAPIKPEISYGDFTKLDVRVGTILNVEEVAGADTLMRLTVSFGDHQRNILAGIKKERTNPQSLIGCQSLFVVNLAPRKMMGELSEGMLFDIGYEDKLNPVLAVPEKAIPDGSRAG